MHKENWDDLRYVLAVAETGSVSGAARQLGVNHATVLRRVAAFEERQGVELFEKTARGYSVSPDKLKLLDAVREVENSVLTLDRIIRTGDAPLRGTVRITSTDTFCLRVLPQIAARIQARAEGLRLQLLNTNLHLDLGRLHADVTVRPTMKLPEDLLGDHAASLGFGIYRAQNAAPGWLSVSGAPKRSVMAEWMEQHIRPSEIVGASDSFVTLTEMAAQGMGQAVLPRLLGDADSRLTLVSDGPIAPPAAVPIWVACHTDLAEVPRIRAVRRQLVAGLGKLSGQLDPDGQ